MRKVRPLLSLSLLATIASVNAEGTTELATVHQAKCTSCHQTEVYTRSDRKVTSLEGLHRQVQRCELALNLQWFDDEIAAMTDHLDKGYYHFTP